MYRKLDPNASRWIVEALARLTLTAAILLGLVIFFGADSRFSGPSLAVALTFPGAPESWGVLAFVCGVAGLLGSLTKYMAPVRWSLLGFAAWCGFFATSIAQAAWESPMAALTGPVIYAFTGIASVVLAVAHKEE